MHENNPKEKTQSGQKQHGQTLVADACEFTNWVEDIGEQEENKVTFVVKV